MSVEDQHYHYAGEPGEGPSAHSRRPHHHRRHPHRHHQQPPATVIVPEPTSSSAHSEDEAVPELQRTEEGKHMESVREGRFIV